MNSKGMGVIEAYSPLLNSAICCFENKIDPDQLASVKPDQLASVKPADQNQHCFPLVCMTGILQVNKIQNG